MEILRPLKEKVDAGEMTIDRIAQETDTHPATVRRWIQYVESDGQQGRAPSYKVMDTLFNLLYEDMPATWCWDILIEQDHKTQSIEYARLVEKYGEPENNCR